MLSGFEVAHNVLRISVGRGGKETSEGRGSRHTIQCWTKPGLGATWSLSNELEGGSGGKAGAG